MASRYGLKPVLNRRNDALANVDPLEFERLIGAWYERQGYRVEQTGTGGRARRFDGGIDLKLYRHGQCTLVQCKRENAFQVTHNVVHELLGILETAGADRGIVITTGEFTPYARESAAKSPRMELIDGDELRQMLGNIPEPLARPLHPKSVEGTFAETAMERLLVAAEHRIRGETRKGVSRAAKWGVGIVVVKGLTLLVLLLVIWWGFKIWTSMATGALQRSQGIGAAEQAPPQLPVPQLEAGQPALTPIGNVRPVYRAMGPGDNAASQRSADEAMRVLAPNTPEVMRMPSKAE